MNKADRKQKGLNMIRDDLLIDIFCCVDDFCKEFEPEWQKMQLEFKIPKKDLRKKRSSGIALSEIMTIVIFFHHSRFRTFKDYYIYHVKNNLKHLFPNLVSCGSLILFFKTGVNKMKGDAHYQMIVSQEEVDFSFREQLDSFYR